MPALGAGNTGARQPINVAGKTGYKRPTPTSGSIGGAGRMGGSGLSSANMAQMTQQFGAPPARIAPSPSGTYGARAPMTSNAVSSDGGGGVDTGGGGGGAVMDTAPAAPVTPSDQEWLANGDPGYAAQSGGIQAELTNLLAQISNERSSYDVDFGNSMKQMGWKGNALATDGNVGSWDPEDMSGAYGQTLAAQENDFAGRGMMGSSFYDKAKQQTNADFTTQGNSMMSDRTARGNTWTGQADAGRLTAEKADLQARAEAFARRSAMYGMNS